jgi:glycosyltransferase involved in cell wall biosynthesis
MSRPRVHLVTPNLTPGDAVSNDVLGMRDYLRREGWPADIYVRYLDPAYRHQAKSYGDYARFRDAREDVLLYHHSTGWPAGRTLFERSRNRKLLRYHNTTPARFFRSYHADYAKACLIGMQETQDLVGADPEGYLADSEFNLEDLVRAGADRNRCRVVPPWHTIGSLDALPEDSETAERLQGETNLLFVGRVAPNKGHRHLIRAMAALVNEGNWSARLWLVGDLDPRLETYHSELQGEIAARGLKNVVLFTGKVSRRQLKTYYIYASLFLCVSEHEGFCVPLVEAMYYRIPIVAYGTSAVRGTLGSQGLAWDSPEPELLAESMRQILEYPPVRQAVIDAQSERFARLYSNPAIAGRFEQALVSLLRR